MGGSIPHRGHEGAVHALALQPRIITISAPRDLAHVARAHSSMPRGKSVEGATTRTRAPAVLSKKILARHPRMHHVAADSDDEPSIRPLLRRMVSASSSAASDAHARCRWY
jgi:hypothetical protein